MNSGHQATDSDPTSTRPTDEDSVYSPYGVVFNSSTEIDYTETERHEESSGGLTAVLDCFYKLKTVFLLKVLTSATCNGRSNILQSQKLVRRSSILVLKRPRKKRVPTFWKLSFIAFSFLISSHWKGTTEIKFRNSSGKYCCKKITVPFSSGNEISIGGNFSSSVTSTKICIIKTKKSKFVALLKLWIFQRITTAELIQRLQFHLTNQSEISIVTK